MRTQWVPARSTVSGPDRRRVLRLANHPTRPRGEATSRAQRMDIDSVRASRAAGPRQGSRLLRALQQEVHEATALNRHTERRWTPAAIDVPAHTSVFCLGKELASPEALRR